MRMISAELRDVAVIVEDFEDLTYKIKNELGVSIDFGCYPAIHDSNGELLGYIEVTGNAYDSIMFRPTGDENADE